MEVGKLIQHVEQKKTRMVISVKPFGCMPSSGVSDGVQSLVMAKHPEAIFCAIETTGDGAVNAQSRVLMDLFKARQRALYYPRHVLAGTASNTLLALEKGLRPPPTVAVPGSPSARSVSFKDGPIQLSPVSGKPS